MSVRWRQIFKSDLERLGEGGRQDIGDPVTMGGGGRRNFIEGHVKSGRRHWAVNYTGTQSFIATLSYSLA